MVQWGPAQWGSHTPRLQAGQVIPSSISPSDHLGCTGHGSYVSLLPWPGGHGKSVSWERVVGPRGWGNLLGIVKSPMHQEGEFRLLCFQHGCGETLESFSHLWGDSARGKVRRTERARNSVRAHSTTTCPLPSREGPNSRRAATPSPGSLKPHCCQASRSFRAGHLHSNDSLQSVFTYLTLGCKGDTPIPELPR